MKRFIVFLLFSVCVFSAFAEYQVFSYRAVIRRIEPSLKIENKMPVETTAVVTDTIKGYLVTVCCYPCNASFGKGYPSWLYVVRAKDKEKFLWQIPVQVDGGIFDSNFSVKNIAIFYSVGIYPEDDIFRNYVKKAGKSWFRMELDTVKTYEWCLRRGAARFYYDGGFLGGKATQSSLSHAGFGTAGWKINAELAPYRDFNPYIKSASGAVIGTSSSEGFSFDPSNYDVYNRSPVVGSFSILFNKRLTEKIRGFADWSIIDSIIYNEVRHRKIQKEDDNTSLQYIENFY